MKTQNTAQTNSELLTNTHKKISDGEILEVLKDFSGEGGTADLMPSELEEKIQTSIYFGESEGYRYKLNVIGEKRNYFRIVLSFGTISDMIPEAKLGEFKEKINSANKELRCVKGYYGILDDDSDESGEVTFAISYEFFTIPSLTKNSLKQHVKIATQLLDTYAEDTLDAMLASGDFDE